MDIGTISSRYAKALFSLAKEKGLETRVYDDMKMLADSFSLEPGLRVALGNPILPAEEKLKLLTAAGGIEVSDLYERFMHLVLEHKRESLLLFMAHIYIHLYRKDKRITRATLMPRYSSMKRESMMEPPIPMQIEPIWRYDFPLIVAAATAARPKRRSFSSTSAGIVVSSASRTS